MSTALARLVEALPDSRADLAAALESSSDGLLVTDGAGRIRHCNRRFAELWGMPPELPARGDDDAVLDWMRRRSADPAAYMRRLSELENEAVVEAVDWVPLNGGGAMQRITRPQRRQGRVVGRVQAFRPVPA